MKPTIAPRATARTVRAAGVSVIVAAAITAGMAGAGASAHQGTAAPAAGSATHTTAHVHGTTKDRPLQLGNKITAKNLPDSPAKAKARGEVRATTGRTTSVHRTPASHTSPSTTTAKASATSTNWSGYVATGANGTFQGAIGDWYVPQVYVSGQNRYGCTWVGVDGYTNSKLIQAGTEEDYVNGKAVYYAWAEILPASQSIIMTGNTRAVVKPGDAMFAYVYQTSAGVYRMYLDDQTQNWYYDHSVNYSALGANVEWIQEATQIGGTIQKPTNFGTVAIGDIYVLEGGTWYRTAMNSGNILNLKQGSTTYTATSLPTNTAPQTFSVKYVGP